MITWYQNDDGTYNGVEVLSHLSGVSRAEITWTWERLRALLAAGHTKEQAKSVVAEEARQKPWEKLL